MASREVTRTGQIDWRTLNPPPGDIWQGYDVYRTVNNGIEAAVRTSKAKYGILWIGLTVAVVGVLVIAAAMPAAGPLDRNYSQGLTVILCSLCLLAVVGARTCILYGLLPEEQRRQFAPEPIEIRPEGVTINKIRFFSREEVLTLTVAPDPKASGGYRYACQGIGGTRQMILLAGLDEPTATRLGGMIEEAKRSRWADPQFDD